LKLVLSDTMDIGHSFGIDDDFFNNEKIQNTIQRHFKNIELPSVRQKIYEQSIYEIFEFPIGHGVYIDTRELFSSQDLIDSAIECANDDYSEDTDIQLIIENIKATKIINQFIIFYSIGLFITRIEIEIPNSCVDNIGKIVNCFYNAPDEDWFETKINSFKDNLIETTSNSDLPKLTKRETICSSDNYYFLIIDETLDAKNVRKQISDEWNDFEKKIETSYGNSQLNWGYVGSLMQIDTEDDCSERYIYLMENLALYNTFAFSLESTLDLSLKEIVKKNLAKETNNNDINLINTLKI